ncbi:MAG: putative tellurite resistance protein B-like protein [Cognaticolwellia sp.]|jgi:uncharacterized tellurite resistance protein B-like protein
MRSIMKQMVQIDQSVGYALVQAMREVAAADGDHPRELLLIQSFEDELPAGNTDTVDLSVVNTSALKEAFIKSLVLVAFADMKLGDEETDVIRGYAQKLGLGEREVSRAISDVAAALLSNLAGVKQSRAQVEALGKAMGLDQFTIDEVLNA